MTPKNNILALFFICQTITLLSQQPPQHLFYINQYKDLAIKEMTRTGIPASITLAQGILESGAGQSELARMASNQFGIKCGDNWPGATYYKKDDDYDQEGQLTYSCFRSYPSVEASFQDHSNYLTNPGKTNRYGFLFQLDPTNYRQWAEGLQQAGYASSETYPQKLIGIIERYDLNQYDLVFPARNFATPVVVYPTLITTTNEVSFTLTSGFETVGDIAYRTQVPVDRLLEINEGAVNGYVMPQGEKIYLQPKRNAFKGPLPFHRVNSGESIYDIAQRYGIRLDQLEKRNRLEPDQQPESGQIIKLRGSKVKSVPANNSGADIGFDRDELPGSIPEQAPLVVLPEGPASAEKPASAIPGENPSITTTVVTFHVVGKNDTLWSIARQYNTDVEQLIRLNDLNNHIIRRGMQLRVR